MKPLPKLNFSRDEFGQLRALQIERRWDWPATFSTNCHGEVWPYSTPGFTHEVDREPVRGISRVIDEVVDAYLTIRPEGGRFFIDEKAAFYKVEADALRVIAVFELK